jgi:hypothetical protein
MNECNHDFARTHYRVFRHDIARTHLQAWKAASSTASAKAGSGTCGTVSRKATGLGHSGCFDVVVLFPRGTSLSQAVGTYAMTELRFAVSPDVVLQINPGLGICLYLLTIGTNGQNATNRFGDINARAYVASELAIFVKPWHPAVKNPAILPIMPPQPILHSEFLALIKSL